MASEVTDTYKFENDAAGLGDFIAANIAAIDATESPVVYVEDENGMDAISAVWIKEILTDGSVACKLRIRFRS